MRRAFLAGFCTLAFAATGTAVAPVSYEDAFAALGAGIDAGIAGIPVPPATSDEKKALKAWNGAKRTADKAVGNPSAKGFTKAGGKIEKSLRKAFPEDPSVATLLDDFAAALVAATAAELDALGDSVAGLPPGDDADFLLGLLGGIQDLVDQAADAGTAADAHSLCSGAARLLGSVEKKYNKALSKAVGTPGMSALVGGVPFSTTLLEGSIVTDPATGRPVILGLSGVVLAGDGAESILLGIDLGDSGNFIVPGTYAITGLGVEGGYMRTGSEGLEESITGESGTLTIASIDATRGTVSGLFEFTGPSLGGGPVSVTSGRFNATNLVVTELE